MYLVTFGKLELEQSNFKRSKALLLLTYLTLEGKRERSHLAELFWPHNDNALGNLSMTLSRLKKVTNAIESDNTHVWAQLESDTQQLANALQTGDLDTAIELYKGFFLEGVSLRNTSIELEEWLYEKREYYAGLARGVILQKAKTLGSKGHFEEAATLAINAYLLRYAPEPEANDLEQMYTLLKAAEHSSTRDVQKEAVSFGLALNLTKEEARASLKTSTESNVVNLPNFLTKFVGRKEEIEKLKQELPKPEVRLLTLLSQGGMGKTRLAVELAKGLSGQFSDGICFASFVSTPTPEQMLFTLGDALDYSFFGSDSAKDQLLRFLKDKEMLLILDNLEHLLEGTSFISDILLNSAKLKILTTSRESLNLQAERIYELKGLDFSGESQEEADAIKLFVQAAQNKQPDFMLNEETARDVSKICQLVAGMPLALELSASWLRTLSLKSIVKELEKGIGLLQTTARDLPERHQSIRAVFDYSWQLLTNDEKKVLSNLAVFRGGFSRDAAKKVVGASLPILSSLIEKSFLSRVGHERYRRHPLVIQYSQEKLYALPDEKARIEEAHARYFLEYIRTYSPKLRTLERKEILEKLEPDFTNVRKAWLWAVHKQKAGEIIKSSTALNHTFGNRLDEAAELFDKAIQGLDENNPKHKRALGYALVHRGKYTSETSDYSISSVAAARKGIELLSEFDDYSGIVLGLKYTISYHDREPDGSSPFREALNLARKYGESHDIGLFLHRQLLFERNTGSFSVVKQHFKNALKEVRQIEEPITEVAILVIYGSYLVYSGEVNEGILLLEESLRLNQILDLQASYVGIYVELGYAMFKVGNFSKAKTYFYKSLNASGKVHWSDFQAKAYGYLGRIATHEKSRDDAFAFVAKSLELSHSSPHHFAENLLAFAELSQNYISSSQAVEVLSFVSHYSSTEKRDLDQARELLDELKSRLSKKEFEDAVEKGKELELPSLMEEVIRELNLEVCL